jgi:hypothetical protein
VRLEHNDVAMLVAEIRDGTLRPTFGGEALTLVRPNLGWVHMLTPLVVDDTELHNIALNTKRPDMPKRRTVPTSSAAGSFQF